jgi:GNAT superfamily N-acetyltransferase
MRAGGATRKDANPAHVRAFTDMARRCGEDYLNRLGDDQMILQICGTHRDYRRRGLATALCRWGMDVADRDGLVTTLVTADLGLYLFRHLGFEGLGECVMQAPGEERKINFWAMARWASTCRAPSIEA